MIDWEFISDLEGRRLDGYVPDPQHSKSGVTIAAGVDLSQITMDELHALQPALRAKLMPYVGLRGEQAIEKLKTSPLRITVAEAAELNRIVEEDETSPTKDAFFRETRAPFEALPDAVQTIVASVAFQYGNLPRRCPKLWSTIIAMNYRGMIECLRDFGDHYPTRRNKEADYLVSHLYIQTEGTTNE